MKKVTLLIPCYNEEKTLPLLYPELKKQIETLNSKYEWEILFVDDGSRDATLDIIKALRAADPQISYVSLSRNFGKENAMLAGFDYAQGDCVIILDADLQDPPSLIPSMLDSWEEGYQDVYAKRSDRGKESWLRRKMALLFYKLLDKSTSFDMLQNVGDFRLLDRQCVEALRTMRETERYSKGLFCWIGYKKKEIIFDRSNRIAGHSKWGFWKLCNLALDGITSFTTTPLRFVTIFGAIIAIIAFCLMLFYGIKTIILGDEARGFTTLVVIILFMGGIQLLSIGILGEYIGRIFKESKRRPAYLATEHNEKKI